MPRPPQIVWTPASPSVRMWIALAEATVLAIIVFLAWAQWDTEALRHRVFHGIAPDPSCSRCRTAEFRRESDYRINTLARAARRKRRGRTEDVAHA